jgi:hypothetical protein
LLNMGEDRNRGYFISVRCLSHVAVGGQMSFWPLKAHWSLYIPPELVLKILNYALCTVIRINKAYFPTLAFILETELFTLN